jgi:predicted TPR repeat methyltransferase
MITKGMFKAAEGMKQARKFRQAEALYKQILTAEPGNWQAHNNLGNLLADRADFAGSAVAYQKALVINPGYADGHNNLGTVLRETGDLDGAVACYRRALEINIDHAGVHFNLATALNDQHKHGDAEASYRRAAELGHQAAQYMLDSVTGRVPEAAPQDYVTGLFDDYAERFEKNLVEDLGYRVPEQLRTQLQAACPTGSCFTRVIDLGCGSGLVGIQLRPLAATIIGVDLSPGMLEHARQKNIYDELVQADIIEFLAATGDRFTLFTAADLFVYIGNLEPVFSAIRGSATAEAWFALSIEATNEADYKLNGTGRYSHSKSYIERLSRKFGFAMRSCEAQSIRKQNGNPVDGYLFVLQLDH